MRWMKNGNNQWNEKNIKWGAATVLLPSIMALALHQKAQSNTGLQPDSISCTNKLYSLLLKLSVGCSPPTRTSCLTSPSVNCRQLASCTTCCIISCATSWTTCCTMKRATCSWPDTDLYNKFVSPLETSEQIVKKSPYWAKPESNVSTCKNVGCGLATKTDLYHISTCRDVGLWSQQRRTCSCS